MSQQSNNQDHVWVYGKSTPGWYIARWSWNQAYADNLIRLGYKVMRSTEKPKNS